MIVIDCGHCPVCGLESALLMTDEQGSQVIAWLMAGRPGFIQEALPFLSAEKRELLITGSHSDCFDRAFPDD